MIPWDWSYDLLRQPAGGRVQPCSVGGVDSTGPLAGIDVKGGRWSSGETSASAAGTARFGGPSVAAASAAAGAGTARLW